jgi:nitrate reductase assembly molybdenum cofactor insertion protein NarJ
MKKRNQYNHLANLFRYPMADYKDQVNACSEFLKTEYPEAYLQLIPFVDFVNQTDLYEIEEVFGKTFHIQAICYLDLGYVLFAEDYKRGEFLVQMKKEQAKVNNDCGVELADNLPNVLTLMALIEEEDFLVEFAVRVVKVGIEKMLQEFSDARIALKDKVRKKKQKVILMEDLQNKNIYVNALNSILEVLKKDFSTVEYNDPEIVPTLGGNVLGQCGTSCSVDHKPLKTN